jgi:hypothetical protein
MQRSARRILLAVILFLNCTSSARVGDTDADLDAYKIAVTGLWWFSSPTGSFQARGTTSVSGSFDLSKDFGFGSYSTFSGQADWRFKRKHHLLVGIVPISSSRTTTLTRTFTFQGQTFDARVKTSANIDSSLYAPGYRYDIFRRNRIIFSIPVQVFLGKVSAALTATGTLNGLSATKSASGSIFAALPGNGIFQPPRNYTNFRSPY